MIRSALAGLGCVALMSGLAACGASPEGPTPTAPHSMEAPATTTETSAMALPSDTTSTESSPSPTNPQTPPPESSTSPPSESTGPSSQGPIPELLRGTWALVEEGENTVTVAQCQIPPAPPGSVITVTGNGIQYFETVATVEVVTQSDARSIEADFAEPSGDAVLARAIRLDSQDDGQALVTRDLTEGAMPEPQRYLRCPTRASNT